MMLSQELLDAVIPCKEGYDIGFALGCLNMDSAEVITILEANNHHDYANWVRNLDNNPIALKISGEYASACYCVYNPVDNVYLSTQDETQIGFIKQTIIDSNPAVDQTLITVRVALKTLSGQPLYAQLDNTVVQMLAPAGPPPTTTATTTSTGYMGSIG
jgi:hypothetical protein